MAERNPQDFFLCGERDFLGETGKRANNSANGSVNPGRTFPPSSAWDSSRVALGESGVV
jgi:hypothetical protein